MDYSNSIQTLKSLHLAEIERKLKHARVVIVSWVGGSIFIILIVLLLKIFAPQYSIYVGIAGSLLSTVPLSFGLREAVRFRGKQATYDRLLELLDDGKLAEAEHMTLVNEVLVELLGKHDGLTVTKLPRSEGRDQASEAEPLLLGMSVPKGICKGDEFTARFVAYAKSFEKEIESQLNQLSPRAQSYLGMKSCRWAKGTAVKVRVYGNHLYLPSPEEEFIWQGEREIVDFDVTMDSEAPSGVTIIKCDVSIGGIIVAKLRVDIMISSQTNQQTSFVRSEPARTAFASYASKDRLRVLDRVSEVRKSGVDVFLDCLSLNPGDQWKPKLEQEIKNRELFILFWSVEAKQSTYVDWEWRTALREKGLNGIDPHPLDPVFEAEPPIELSELHFEDAYMLARRAYNQTP